MDFPLLDLPDLAPAYLHQFGFPHTGHYELLPAQQLDGSYGVNQTSPSTLQAQLFGGPSVATQNHAFSFTPASVSAGPVSPMAPPDRPRKRKAATLRADDWEPYKKRILDLHIEQGKSLPEVRQIVEENYGFKAELRQYRSRVSQWGKDKNVKPQEMQAIVRKRQKRKLVETNKRPLVFEVRDSLVEQPKIERWMKRHNVADSFLYSPSPAASTPSAVGCHMVSERGSPAMISVYTPAASVSTPASMDLAAQSSQMPSPALSISSIVRPQHSVFAGQSPALAQRFLPSSQFGSIHGLSTPGGAMDVGVQTRYREDEEMRLWGRVQRADTSLTSRPWEISDTLCELAEVLMDQGRYRTAETQIRKLVMILKSQSSNNDDGPEMLEAFNLLGQVLMYQGSYVKAERVFRRVIRGKQGVLGYEHQSTLTSICNLAQVLDDQSKYKEAEVIFRETLALQEKVLGQVLSKQGRHKEAGTMNREALALKEKVLGQEHPKTLTSVYSLAELLTDQRCYNEALDLYKRACTGFETVLGRDHPITSACHNDYASVLASEQQG